MDAFVVDENRWNAAGRQVRGFGFQAEEPGRAETNELRLEGRKREANANRRGDDCEDEEFRVNQGTGGTFGFQHERNGREGNEYRGQKSEPCVERLTKRMLRSGNRQGMISVGVPEGVMPQLLSC